MDSITPYQQTALQITRASNEIATAKELADYRLAKNPDGSFVHARYKDGNEEQRIAWLGEQFFGLSAITHTALTATSVALDVTSLDQEIMRNSVLREMTLVEMQEAFRNGVFKEYGDYYGLTAVSMFGFLKGYCKADKKLSASVIVNRHYAKLEQERDAKFFRELYEAEKAGKITLPDFSQMRINGPQGKKVYTPEESAAHREKVRRQAEEILRQQKQAENGTQEEPQQ